MPIIALSGIASPKGFEDELGHLGSQVLFHQTYADHHRYNQQEIIDLINGALEQGAQAIITTEKDAVRMPHIERRDVPIYYLRVEIEMLSGEEQFYEWINRICFTATF
jgi:tetraacyldisaccharide 4'-kinase